MAGEGNWSAGERVPRTGTYRCSYCGPDGMGASVLKIAMKNMGIPYSPPASARKKPPLKFLKEGDSFPSCPNCKLDPSGADATGWDFVSEKDMATTAKAGVSKPDMVYFECTRPSGDGTCSDDSCPCGYPGANIPRGTGYFYISKELVEMRRDALTLAAIQSKVMKLQQQMGATMVTATGGVFMPILMCEQGAKKRGLDLTVAAADAKHWWETGLAPLRPTPMAGENARSRSGAQTAQKVPCSQCGAMILAATAAQNSGKCVKCSKAGKSGCFIATACYGSPDCPEVLDLRRWRDERLAQRLWGPVFIELYYRFSPPVAAVLRRSARLRALVRQWVVAPLSRRVGKGRK